MQLFFIGLGAVMVLLICFSPLLIYARNRRRMRQAEFRQRKQDFDRRRAQVEAEIEGAKRRMI